MTKEAYKYLNYFEDLKSSGLNVGNSLIEIMNRLFEYYDVIDGYLSKLERIKVIDKETRDKFLIKSFKMLFDEVYIKAIMAYEGVGEGIGQSWLKEEKDLIEEVRKKIKGIRDEISKEVRKSLFTSGLKIENVGYSTSKKSKGSQRQEPKKSGRPKLAII